MGKRMVIKNQCPFCKYFLWKMDEKGTTLFCKLHNKRLIIRYQGLKNCPDFTQKVGGK